MKSINWHEKLQPYTVKSNSKAYWQSLSTISLYLGVWYLYSLALEQSLWWSLPFSFLTACLLLRFFVLMHDCGHRSLFPKGMPNKFFGYLFGVLVGMPQYVWSKHHAYHHKTNGDWEKYKGPLSTISTVEYEKLSAKQKKNYWFYRQPLFLLPGGFIYILFNPRFNWMRGVLNVVTNSFLAIFKADQSPVEVLRSLKSRFWKSKQEFWHMTYNNVTLLTIWALMISWIGFTPFFIVYGLSHAIAGGAGILFFTLQHNFEHSYASDTKRLDSDRAAIEGTSYLVFSPLMNYLTANIGYHHIHHLSTAVPNYQLKRCHQDLQHLFTGVKRIKFSEIPKNSGYLLWDEKSEKIISRKEYQAREHKQTPAASCL